MLGIVTTHAAGPARRGCSAKSQHFYQRQRATPTEQNQGASHSLGGTPHHPTTTIPTSHPRVLAFVHSMDRGKKPHPTNLHLKRPPEPPPRAKGMQLSRSSTSTDSLQSLDSAASVSASRQSVRMSHSAVASIVRNRVADVSSQDRHAVIATFMRPSSCA